MALSGVSSLFKTVPFLNSIEVSPFPDRGFSSIPTASCNLSSVGTCSRNLLRTPPGFFGQTGAVVKVARCLRAEGQP